MIAVTVGKKPLHPAFLHSPEAFVAENPALYQSPMMSHRLRLKPMSVIVYPFHGWERQTLQLHAITGTPCDVPVPKMVTLTIHMLSIYKLQ